MERNSPHSARSFRTQRSIPSSGRLRRSHPGESIRNLVRAKYWRSEETCRTRGPSVPQDPHHFFHKKIPLSTCPGTREKTIPGKGQMRRIRIYRRGRNLHLEGRNHHEVQFTAISPSKGNLLHPCSNHRADPCSGSLFRLHERNGAEKAYHGTSGSPRGLFKVWGHCRIL